MKKFNVTGYAFVPVLVQMTIEARDAKEALIRASLAFGQAERKSRFVVPGTEDESAVFDWEPSEAKQVE